MSQDKGNAFFSAKIGDPVPGEDALYSYNNVLTVWSNGLQKDIGIGFDIPVKNDLSLLIEDAEVRCSGVQIDTARLWHFGDVVTIIDIRLGNEEGTASLAPLSIFADLRKIGIARKLPRSV